MDPQCCFLYTCSCLSLRVKEKWSSQLGLVPSKWAPPDSVPPEGADFLPSQLLHVPYRQASGYFPFTAAFILILT